LKEVENRPKKMEGPRIELESGPFSTSFICANQATVRK